jgi:hypothetical protein
MEIIYWRYGIYLATASLAPQFEHFPSSVILDCSLTSPLQRPHFKEFTSKKFCYYNIDFS